MKYMLSQFNIALTILLQERLQSNKGQTILSMSVPFMKMLKNISTANHSTFK